jgi:hypothetical protein
MRVFGIQHLVIGTYSVENAVNSGYISKAFANRHKPKNSRNSRINDFISMV